MTLDPSHARAQTRGKLRNARSRSGAGKAGVAGPAGPPRFGQSYPMELGPPPRVPSARCCLTLSRLTLAELLGTTPASSVFKDLVVASRFYGLTESGINADEFSTTEL